MNTYYKLSEEELTNLLLAAVKLECLEQDGVDNWEWYMENKYSYLADELGISLHDVEDNDLDFKDLVIKLIKSYPKSVEY